MRRSRIAARVIVALTALTVSVAGAEPQEAVLAETLFRQGKAAMDAGRYEEACPKLAESLRLDRAGGTQLALGLCYERTGKYASAWVAFLDAVALAQKDGRKDREKIAREHAAAAEKLSSRVTIAVGENASVEDLAVLLDGVSIAREMWSTALPVDPGSHEIRATAPTRRAWSTTVVLADPGERSEVTVPLLQTLPTAEPSGREAVPKASPRTHTPKRARRRRAAGKNRDREAPESSGISQQTIALACGGLGLALLATGTVFGVRALSKGDEVCDTRNCPPDQRDEYDEYRTSANVANVTLGLGVVSLGVSIVLLLTDGSSQNASRTQEDANSRAMTPSLAILPRL